MKSQTALKAKITLSEAVSNPENGRLALDTLRHTNRSEYHTREDRSVEVDASEGLMTMLSKYAKSSEDKEESQ
jgi:hypothetical protein